jgi:hypothetical protein
LEGAAVGNFAYALSDGDLLTFTVEDGKVLVPEGVTKVYHLAMAGSGEQMGSLAECASYAAAAAPHGTACREPLCGAD